MKIKNFTDVIASNSANAGECDNLTRNVILRVAKNLAMRLLLLTTYYLLLTTHSLFAAATWTEALASDFADGYLVQTDTWTSADNVELAITSYTAWYNDDWLYRKPITITNSTATLANFQVWIPTGTDANQIDIANADLDSKLQDDYDDVRFTDSDGTTLLDYWICPSTINKTDPTGFWVEVPSISEGTTKTIYFYYGNDSANTNLSSFDNTMQKLSTTTAFDSYDGRVAAAWHFDDSNLGTELITNNRELDTWTDSTDLTFWVEESTDTAMRKVTEESVAEFIYSGSRSAKLEAIDNNYTSFYIKQTFDTVVDENYQISFYLKYSSRTEGAITAEVWNDGSLKAYQTISSTVGFTDSFRFVSFRATATAAGVNAGELKIWMSSETYGYAYVDLVSIKKSAVTTADATNNNTGTIAQTTSGAGASFTDSDGGRYDDISTATVKFATGDSLRFDGVDDNVRLGNLGNFSEITISWWRNANPDTTLGREIYDGYGVTTVPIEGTGNKIHFCLGNGSAWTGLITTNNNIEANRWYHFAITYNGSLIALYVDGVAQADIESWPSEIVNLNDLNIGSTAAGAFFDGTIDEVAVYNVALSSGEIKSHYERRKYAHPEPAVTIVGSEETKYYSAGSYASDVYDTGATGSTMTVVWFSSSDVSGGTLYLEVRSSDTLFAQGDADPAWETISDSSDTAISSTGQYFQYRSSFTTSYSTTTPVLNDVSITYACPPSTTPPLGVEATGVSIDSITWIWTDQTPGGGVPQEDGFKIYTSTDGLLNTVAADVTTWQEEGLSLNTQYSRYVQVYNIAGSSNSVIISTYTLANKPGMPTAARVTGVINIIINENSNPSWTEFAIAISTDDGGVYNYYVGSDDSIGSDIEWRTKSGWYGGSGVNVGGLSSTIPYKFEVNARNGDNIETGNGAATGTTYMGITPPSGIDAVVFVTSISLTATGVASDDDVWFYEVNTPLNSGWSIDESTWTAINLSTNTPYGFQVKRKSEDGQISDYTSSILYVHTKAAPPTGLSILYVSGSGITLTWTHGENLNTRFGVERSYDAGGGQSGWTYIKSWSDGLTSTSYTDTSISGDTTYWYRIRGYNGDGTVTSTYSNEVTTTTWPLAPTGFTGVAQSTYNINWSWTNNSTTVTSYKVYNTTDTDNAIATLALDATSYSEPELLANTSYARYATVYNPTGYANSGSSTIYTLANIPTDLTVPNIYATSMTLTWSGDGTRYAVECTTIAGEGWAYIQSWADALTTTSYTNTSITGDTTYWYRVSAYNGDAQITTYSDETSTATRPSAATNFTGAAQASNSINWTWTNNSATVTGYRVMTSTDGVVADLSADVTSYTETGLSANIAYTRYANAVNPSGGIESNSAAVYTLTNIPGSLSASEVYITSITIIWSGDGTRYSIERSTDITNWTYIQQWSNALTSSTYTDTGLNYSTSYYYRVSAYNADAAVTYPSSQLEVITLADTQPPAAPSSVTIGLPSGQTKIKIGDTLTLSASAEAGTTIYSITIKDQDGNILAQWLEPSGTVSLSVAAERSSANNTSHSPIQMSAMRVTPSGDVSASILIGDIAARYPMAKSITIELVVQDAAGNKSQAASSAAVSLAANVTRSEVYNNLFNPVTGGKATIRYEITQAGEVEIKIYTLNGEKVISLVGETKDAGIYYIEWDGRDRDGDFVASGTYILYIEGPDLKEKKKICVIK